MRHEKSSGLRQNMLARRLYLKTPVRAERRDWVGVRPEPFFGIGLSSDPVPAEASIQMAAGSSI
jgi:hypothetical protein